MRFTDMLRAWYDGVLGELRTNKERADRDTDPDPTAKQKRSGDYDKGSFDWNGQKIVVETPAGAIRKGKNFENLLQHSYGYFDGTEGNDGDPVDVFIGSRLDSPNVYVIDQYAPETGEFDEHKVVIGVDSMRDAQAIYEMSYDPDWNGMGTVGWTDVPSFLDWLRNGDKSMPVNPIEDVDVITANGGGVFQSFDRTAKLVLKAHIKTHPSRSKKGKLFVVREHEDKRGSGLWMKTPSELEQMPTATLDKAAFGFKSGDTITLTPSKVTGLSELDMANVREQIAKSGKTPKEWAMTVDLSEPIAISLSHGELNLDDGHHRLTAATLLRKPIRAVVEIHDNPLRAIYANALAKGRTIPKEAYERYPNLKPKKSLDAVPVSRLVLKARLVKGYTARKATGGVKAVPAHTDKRNPAKSKAKPQTKLLNGFISPDGRWHTKDGSVARNTGYDQEHRSLALDLLRDIEGEDKWTDAHIYTSIDELLKRGWARVNNGSIEVDKLNGRTKSAVIEYVSQLPPDRQVRVEARNGGEFGEKFFEGYAAKFLEEIEKSLDDVPVSKMTLKARIKAHMRRKPKGGVTTVREHEDKRRGKVNAEVDVPALGWISPQGVIHEVKPSEYHEKTARSIVSERYRERARTGEHEGTSMLLKKGWVRMYKVQRFNVLGSTSTNGRGFEVERFEGNGRDSITEVVSRLRPDDYVEVWEADPADPYNTKQVFKGVAREFLENPQKSLDSTSLSKLALKAHIKAHPSKTHTGKATWVKEYDDKRQKKQQGEPEKRQSKQQEDDRQPEAPEYPKGKMWAMIDELAGRAKDRLDTLKEQYGGSLFDEAGVKGRQVLDDLALIGAAKLIKNGTHDFDSFAAEMRKEYGKEVQGALAQVYKKAQKTVKDALNDLSIIGASKLYSGNNDKKKWQEAMTAEYGQNLKNHFDELYGKSQKYLQTIIERTTNGLPSLQQLLALNEKGMTGMGWYDAVREDLHYVFGDDTNLFIGFLAATSPNNAVAGNVTQALKAYGMYKSGQKFEDAEKGRGFLPAHVTNLNRFLQDGTVNGRKVNNFLQAMLGKEDAVTVDRWMGRAFGLPISSGEGADEKSRTIKDDEYTFIEDVIRDTAKELKMTPRQVQAAIWAGARDDDGFSSESGADFGTMTRKKLRDIWDKESFMGQKPSKGKTYGLDLSDEKWNNIVYSGK